MQQVSIGLIGFGIWGQKILEELIFMKIKVHVFELVKKRMHEALALGASSFDTDFEVFMKYPHNGIIIASSSSSHADILHNLAPYDLPVFVEKPLTNNYQDLLIIQNLDLKSVFVMHIWKYHPGVQLLASLTKGGALGEIKGVKSMRTNWTSPRKDTDTLWNLAIHDLSICECILGYIPEQKQVVVEKHNSIIRGVSVLMGNEPFYSFEVSNRYPEKLREVRIFGTKGVAILKDEKVDHVTIYQGDDQSELGAESITRIQFDPTPPLRLELRAFQDYLIGGPPPATDIEEGIRLILHLVEIERKCMMQV